LGHLVRGATGTTWELSVVVLLPVVVLLLGTSVLVLVGSSELLLLARLPKLRGTSVVGSASNIVLSVLPLKSWLDDLDKLLEEREHLWFLEHLYWVAHVLSLVVLEVSLVSELFVLCLSDFLNLVVADVELLSIEVVVVELLLGLGGFLGILEAHESINYFVVLREQLHVLNLTVSSKEFL
jgi:hypothetical protein